VAEDTAARDKYPRAKILVIPNGLDTDEFAPRDKGYSRDLWNIPRDAEVVHLDRVRGPERRGAGEKPRKEGRCGYFRPRIVLQTSRKTWNQCAKCFSTNRRSLNRFSRSLTIGYLFSTVAE
jgi:glycosyltransferase involved in cell wall biosynthesis